MIGPSDNSNEFHVITHGDNVMITSLRKMSLLRPEAARLGIWLLALSGVDAEWVAKSLEEIRGERE